MQTVSASIAVASWLAAFGSPAGAAVVASPANDFLDILGVDGHIDSNTTPYINSTGVVADARYIGARHWRDGLKAQASWQLAPLKALVDYLREAYRRGKR